MAEPNELKASTSADSVNSSTPFKKEETETNDKTLHVANHSLHDDNNATMIIKEADLENIKLELESKENEEHTQQTQETQIEEEEETIPATSTALPPHSPSIQNVHSEDKEYSHSVSHKSRDGSIGSITRQTHTDFEKHKSPETNPLDTTKLRHHGDDVEIGAISDDENSPVITPYGAHHESRMPSISYNNMDKELAALRRASRRKWWSPTRVCDWCMHKLIFGKVMVMILTWTTVVDYAKDIYVAVHLGLNELWWEFGVTLGVLFLSLRLMLYLRAIDDSGVSFWKLLIFYLPGSVYADFQIDRFSDVGVCVFWEIAILFGTPFVPFFLIYLAMRKSISLFSCKKNKRSFENPYLLSYAVVEALFETLPQVCLQTYLYFAYVFDREHHEQEIELPTILIAWIVSILVLIKIPIVVWYNWRIVYKLSFKRRHCGEIMSLKYHPIQDLIATGSWDHTVLINSIIEGSKSTSDSSKDKKRKKKSTKTQQIKSHSNDNHRHNQQHQDVDNPEIKAKRVLDHHYNINCVAWMPKFMNSLHDPKSDIIAVAGQGIELFNWRMGKSIGQFPKNRDRDALRRKKRHRTKEVKEVVFSPDGKRLIWCQGKNVLVWDLAEKRELLKIKCIQGNRLGDVMSIDISPNGKYIACGLYQNQIKVYNSYNKDLIRVLEGHTAPVMCVKFDRQGKYVISGGADCKVRVFDLRYGEQVKQFDKHTSDVLCISIDYTNRFIASAGRDKILYITYLDDEEYNVNKEDSKLMRRSKSGRDHVKPLRELKQWIPYKTQRDIRCCDFSPYGDTVACASEDHQVHVLSLPPECQARHHRFSTDVGNILHKVHTKNDSNHIQIISGRNGGNNNHLNRLQEIQSNDEILPDPPTGADTEATETQETSRGEETHLNQHHQNNSNHENENGKPRPSVIERQFSNLDAITTNNYSKFDPKEHKIW